MSARRAEERLYVLESFGLSEIKTKDAALVLSRLGVAKGDKALVVLPQADATTERSLRNIAGVKVVLVAGLNAYDLADAKHVVLVGGAVDGIEARLQA